MNKKSKFLIMMLAIFLLLGLVGCGKQKTLESFLNELQLAEETQTDLDLKTTYQYRNETIKAVWTSSNEKAVEINGIIHRIDRDQQVILIVEASLGDKTMKKTFKVTVIADKAQEVVDKIASTMAMEQEENSEIKVSVDSVFLLAI